MVAAETAACSFLRASAISSAVIWFCLFCFRQSNIIWPFLVMSFTVSSPLYAAAAASCCEVWKTSENFSKGKFIKAALPPKDAAESGGKDLIGLCEVVVFVR